MQLLSPMDQIFARMESPRTPMHIGALAIFDLPNDASPDFIHDLYESFAELSYLPFPFDSVLAGGSTYWKQQSPDPAYHVRRSAVPAPGTLAELGEVAEILHSTPLDMNKPLWEAHIIEGLADNRFAFYFKAHHCAIDGMGAVNYIKAWLSTDPGATPESAVPAVPDDDFDLAAVFAVATMKRTVSTVTAAGELLPKLAGMLRGANSTVRAAINTPRTPFNVRIDNRRRLAIESLDLPRLRAVSAATGTTVNDVILACIGGGCRRYLGERDELPKDSLTASVPMGLERDAGTLNATAGLVAPLGTATADPLERVREVSATTSRAKPELQAMSANAQEHFSLLGLLPLAMGQNSGLLDAIPPLFNFTVSNVVLSKQPLYLGGARLHSVVPISFLCDGYGLNVTLVGYTDKVVLGFIGCRDALPDLPLLARYTAEAFDELESAAL